MEGTNFFYYFGFHHENIYFPFTIQTKEKIELLFSSNQFREPNKPNVKVE